MERKRKAKAGILVLLAVGAAVVMILALAAPYGADYNRDFTTKIFDSGLGTDGSGIYLMWEDVLGQDASNELFDREQEAVWLEKDRQAAKWEFRVDESGFYYLGAGYMAPEGNGQELEFDISLDGQRILDPGTGITLTRIWTDSGEFLHTAAGDEIRPAQREAGLWTEEPFRAGKKERIAVWLEEGMHSLSVSGTGQTALIRYLRFYQENLPSYEEYRNAGEGTPAPEFYCRIEGETPCRKSSSQLYAVYDRSSPYTLPYHSTCIRYNTIGGENWSDSGQWIEWQFEVPEDGAYRIGLRYRQNENKGQSSLRRIELDGQVPFAEMAELSFAYDVDWNSGFLEQDGEPYLFYLTKGVHQIRMEVVLGDARETAECMEETLYDLNSLYREIIMITGSSPDTYRDYGLETAIPDLTEKLSGIHEELRGYIAYLENLYGEGCYPSRVLSQVENQAESFLEKPYTIASRLSVFKTNIEALAEWILEFEQQSLQIDYLYVAGAGGEIPEEKENALGRIGHEIRAFFGSFSHSYNEVASESLEEPRGTLTIWMGKGRDQANVMKRLIDAYFTPESGINVNISLVEGALVKATLAGQGPDVNIFTTRGEAMNLAFRGAVASVEELPGFEELKAQYSSSAFVPYEYDGGVYGIPETQEFYVMYIRTDIFKELALEVPDTWEELMALLPILQANGLSIGLPYTDGYATMNNGVGTINLLPTLLAQRGISIYRDSGEGIVTNLASTEAYDAFRQWVNFYVQYDFDLYKDDFNRFRTGEMPIIIATYALYNNLSEAAPEIAGQWIMTAIPGTLREDGSLNRDTSASGTCSIILENCRDKEAAWEFVKWWNSEEVQRMYSAEIESELSTLGRHTPANLEAFRRSTWTEEEKELLLEQWENVVEVPEIPGGYYVTRNVDNAFRQVYYNGENARDTLYYWMNAVNEELLRKQAQLDARQ